MFLAAMILSPVGLVTVFVFAAIAILLAGISDIQPKRLVAGYLGALCALAVPVAAFSYVSPHEAVAIWHVPPDRYWHESFVLFFATYVVAAFIAIIGISVVGIPVLIWLWTRGKATGPWLLTSAIFISAAAGALFYGLMRSSADVTLVGALELLIVSHGVCATGFALAARLPWTFASKLKRS